MYKKVITLTEFILKEERNFTGSTGSFTLLLTQIENASKIIASHIKKAGLVDILGQTGQKNAYDEEVQRLDEFSNHLLVDILSESGQAHAIASEELDKPFFIKKHSGNYTVFLDPLDGSSNIDININVGTIFSIYRKSESFLEPGIKQVAAGYIIYGPSVIFVYSCGNGVNGFTLDPSMGSFLLSHPNIRIPKRGSIYSVNEGYFPLFSKKDQDYIGSFKDAIKPYKLRYVGTMVSDVHRTLLKGGVFMYPADSKHSQGKLRLMYEVNPMSFIMQQAGGMAISNGKNPLDIVPSDFTQKVPVVMGSKEEVEKYMEL
ncbi:class 1 fructose-bisphosphatase [Candidatus Roizmanbacteria bacterium CG_4_10_14_0_8_um_filter_33_9]|uniref:Fructose-1,6-bisphosphatase class 1 n=1 Tax=Candidatus Roizmanbacteria bacterium CG_4_10_14_0_8_um_filter_33_9 TaxID=1974826 RepID=A0A2M7QIX0_9BACT|nr:MAG: class 1 fructose-bisphosphatase [Candidatus Roizmanbacteria bacterium CG_4_10_14_0_8_um_filter_33_9]